MAEVQLLRHATLLVDVGETTLLVDPMLSAPGEVPPVPNSPNDRENPLVPMPDVELAYDAVPVTHRHRDHFDDAAADRLADDDPVLCQPAEAKPFREDGETIRSEFRVSPAPSWAADPPDPVPVGSRLHEAFTRARRTDGHATT